MQAMRGWNLFSLTAVAAAFLLGSCGGGKTGNDEAEIRKLIADGAAFAEQKKIGDLLGLTTEAFRADPGDKDRQEVRGTLFMAFRHYGSFTIAYPTPSVEVGAGKQQAEAKLSFLVMKEDARVPGLKELSNRPDQWIEKTRGIADLYYLELSLKEEGEKWRVERSRIRGTRGFEGD